MTDQFFDDDAPEGPSKSELKRQMKALQDLGKQLADLSETERGKIPMPDKLKEAIDTYLRIKSNEARRRQLQFIGKVMREIDISEIETALEQKQRGHEEESAAFKRLEILRDELIDTGDAAIQKVLDAFPLADRQHLRHLATNARKERSNNKPPTSARKLFRYLRELAES